MRSVPEFLLVAIIVTITPGPGTVAIMRVAVRDGRRSAFSAVVGNSIGLFTWALLSALGISSLIIASEVAHTVLRIGGAIFLVALGVRSLLLLGGAKADDLLEPAARPARSGRSGRSGRAGWQIGLATSLSNPKLALFFIALFPQFLTPGTAVLPASALMAVVVVTLDLLWFGAIILAVERATRVLRPRVRHVMERVAGGVLVGVGVALAVEA
ncbi:LysE family translocator [Paractinoplanes rhizophilus]|uniref:LysE family translocator n=1 Tax=Paractinoplanes rhizophilus TaxID=1416877 RepID=A0ABW2HZ16_9ACTN